MQFYDKKHQNELNYAHHGYMQFLVSTYLLVTKMDVTMCDVCVWVNWPCGEYWFVWLEWSRTLALMVMMLVMVLRYFLLCLSALVQLMSSLYYAYPVTMKHSRPLHRILCCLRLKNVDVSYYHTMLWMSLRDFKLGGGRLE